VAINIGVVAHIQGIALFPICHVLCKQKSKVKWRGHSIKDVQGCDIGT